MIGRKLSVDGFFVCLESCVMGAMSRFIDNFQCNIVWIMRMCENYRRWYRAAIDAEREEKVNISCFDLCDQLTIQRQCVFMNYSGQLQSKLERMWTRFDLCLDCPSNCFARMQQSPTFSFCIIHHRRHRLSSFIKIDFLFAHYVHTLLSKCDLFLRAAQHKKNKVSISLLKSPLRMNSSRCPWAARDVSGKAFNDLSNDFACSTSIFQFHRSLHRERSAKEFFSILKRIFQFFTHHSWALSSEQSNSSHVMAIVFCGRPRANKAQKKSFCGMENWAEEKNSSIYFFSISKELWQNNRLDRNEKWKLFFCLLH